MIYTDLMAFFKAFIFAFWGEGLYDFDEKRTDLGMKIQACAVL